MDFEKLKASWQEQKFEGDLFEKPPSRIAADVQRKAMGLKSRHAAEDAVHVLGSILLVGIWIFMYDARQPLMTRTGIILMMAGMALEALAYVAVRFRHRGERLDLPRNDFLQRERKRLEERIRLMKASLSWLSIPMLAGCVLFLASIVSTIREFLSALAMLAGLWAILIWVNSRRIKKRLVPLIDEINQKLAESETKPT
jgi:hypothetical protein